MANINQQNSSLARSHVNWRARTLLVLGVAGLVISAYLTYKSSNPLGIPCSIGQCEQVLTSQYAKLFGLPVSAFGLAWYVGLLAVTWWVYIKRIWSPMVAMGWVLSGLLFSLYLLYLEAFVIHAYCIWCLSSLGLVVLINVLVLTKPNR